MREREEGKERKTSGMKYQKKMLMALESGKNFPTKRITWPEVYNSMFFGSSLCLMPTSQEGKGKAKGNRAKASEKPVFKNETQTANE